MKPRPQDTSAEEPDGGNPHIRFRGGPRRGNRPGLLNRFLIAASGAEKLCALGAVGWRFCAAPQLHR